LSSASRRSFDSSGESSSFSSSATAAVLTATAHVVAWYRRRPKPSTSIVRRPIVPRALLAGGEVGSRNAVARIVVHATTAGVDDNKLRADPVRGPGRRQRAAAIIALVVVIGRHRCNGDDNDDRGHDADATSRFGRSRATMAIATTMDAMAQHSPAGRGRGSLPMCRVLP
jgi:hypothetical protein